MSTPAVVCPFCAQTVSVNDSTSHMNAHNPSISHEQYEAARQGLDKGNSEE